MRTCPNCKTTILADHWTHCIDCRAALPPVRVEAVGSVLDTLSPSDRYCIDAAANAWINGGGDADGVAWMWPTLQERVRELS